RVRPGGNHRARSDHALPDRRDKDLAAGEDHLAERVGQLLFVMDLDQLVRDEPRAVQGVKGWGVLGPEGLNPNDRVSHDIHGRTSTKEMWFRNHKKSPRRTY